MRASDFSYGDKKLSEFGFVICHFDSGGLDTVSNGAVITFNTIPTLNGVIHELTSTVYEDCLETTIQICKNPCNNDILEISSTEFRELIKWLNRNKFLKLKFLCEDYIDLFYEAIINVSRVEIDGKLIGLELEIKTNRPFALKEPRIISLTFNDDSKVYGWEKYSGNKKLGCVTSDNANVYPNGTGVHTDGFQYISIGEVYKHSINDISHEEGYIYPHTEITVSQNCNLKIHNAIENRDTYIANCQAGEVITMDYPIISSSNSSHDIQNDFNWNFLRIANTYDNSRNDLIVSHPCSIKIEYSPIVKVGL